MRTRILILGAGFGGLELATLLSESLGDEVDVTMIDHGDSFVFGFSKLDVMFGRSGLDAVRHSYADFRRPGVRLLRESITEIDAAAKRVTTDAGVHEGDVLVIALGADYDYEATPGVRAGVNEFYSVPGAASMATAVAEFSSGRAVVGICGAPYKCPPAPSECALMLHDELSRRGVRDQCEIALVSPFDRPVPPSPDASAALEEAFAERDIELVAGRRVAAVDSERAKVELDDGSELDCELFMGVPRHRAPDVVIASGITEDGYVPVDPSTLRAELDGVYAIGDCATAGVPKAGVFSEAAARVVAAELVAEHRGAAAPDRFLGQGSCYIEFGSERVARVDIDFLSGPERTGVFRPPSPELVAEKHEFGASRRARWFGAATAAPA